MVKMCLIGAIIEVLEQNEFPHYCKFVSSTLMIFALAYMFWRDSRVMSVQCMLPLREHTLEHFSST